MFDFYKSKYFKSDLGVVFRAITYFEDAENDEEPYSFDKMTWARVKKKIAHEIKKYFDKA